MATKVCEPEALSPRETELCRYYATGRSARWIARKLHISVRTVETHTQHIRKKLGVHSRDELLDLLGGDR